MESVHNPSNRSWISEKIKLKTHFKSFKEGLAADCRNLNASQYITKRRQMKSESLIRKMIETGRDEDEEKLQMSDELFQEIVDHCSIDHLK